MMTSTACCLQSCLTETLEERQQATFRKIAFSHNANNICVCVYVLHVLKVAIAMYCTHHCTLQHLRHRRLRARPDVGAQGGGRGHRVRGGHLRRRTAHRLQLRPVGHLHAPRGRLGRQERGAAQGRGVCVCVCVWCVCVRVCAYVCGCVCVRVYACVSE